MCSSVVKGANFSCRSQTDSELEMARDTCGLQTQVLEACLMKGLFSLVWSGVGKSTRDGEVPGTSHRGSHDHLMNEGTKDRTDVTIVQCESEPGKEATNKSCKCRGGQPLPHYATAGVVRGNNTTLLRLPSSSADASLWQESLGNAVSRSE